MAQTVGMNSKPHPENYEWPENPKRRVGRVAEVLEFRLLKHSGLIVKVLFEDGHKSTWLHSKDFPVHQLWQGGTATYHGTYA